MARRGSRMSPATPLASAHATPDLNSPPPCAQEPAGHPDGVRATARIRAAHNGRVTTLPQSAQRRPFPPAAPAQRTATAATVGIIGAMSAPLGGDRLSLDITAEDRAELEVTTAAATLALRGPTTAPATYDVRLTVAEHAMPPLAAAAADQRRGQQPAPDLHRRTRRHRTAGAAGGAAPGPGRRGTRPPRQPDPGPPCRTHAARPAHRLRQPGTRLGRPRRPGRPPRRRPTPRS